MTIKSPYTLLGLEPCMACGANLICIHEEYVFVYRYINVYIYIYMCMYI